MGEDRREDVVEGQGGAPPVVSEYKVDGRVIRVDVTDVEKLVLKVDGVESEIDVRDFLTIHDEDIDTLQKQLGENSANYAYYACVLNWYEYVQDKVSREYDALYAKWDWEYRTTPQFANSKEREFKSMREDVQTKREELVKLSYVCKKLKSFLVGVDKMGDRLVQIYSREKHTEKKF